MQLIDEFWRLCTRRHCQFQMYCLSWLLHWVSLVNEEIWWSLNSWLLKWQELSWSLSLFKKKHFFNKEKSLENAFLNLSSRMKKTKMFQSPSVLGMIVFDYAVDYFQSGIEKLFTNLKHFQNQFLKFSNGGPTDLNLVHLMYTNTTWWLIVIFLSVDTSGMNEFRKKCGNMGTAQVRYC